MGSWRWRRNFGGFGKFSFFHLRSERGCADFEMRRPGDGGPVQMFDVRGVDDAEVMGW